MKSRIYETIIDMKNVFIRMKAMIGTTNHKPTVNSAVHLSEVGKWGLRSNSEGTSTGHILITANLKLKCFIQYKDSSLTQALDTYR